MWLIFSRNFGSKEESTKPRQVDAATTAPLSDQQLQSILSGQAPSQYEIKQLIAAVGQSVGKQRDHNEDSVLALTNTISGSSEGVPFGLYIVADGMGGHQFGEVASNAAIRIVGGNITKKFHQYLYKLPTQSLQDFARSDGILSDGSTSIHSTRSAREWHDYYSRSLSLDSKSLLGM
ncbi:MAG: hypothetical protein U0X74_16670 [Anaerolineales bacterium]